MAWLPMSLLWLGQTTHKADGLLGWGMVYELFADTLLEEHNFPHHHLFLLM
jgi:hypothetical protein